MEATVKRSILPKTFIVAFAMLILMVALPVVAYAAAVTSFNVDRTQVNQGQTVTFSIRTNAQANFVWAMVGNTRVNATNYAGNDWGITIIPTAATTSVTIYVNSVNNVNGASVFTVPINVVAAQTAPVVVTPLVPPAPPNLGAMAIASVTETPAIAANSVQLTVVTGAGVNEVWAHFDRNVGEGRFARATMIAQDANSRSWVINFTPRTWAVQTVQIGANRTYDWPGATLRDHPLTLTQPFVAPVNPTITNVTVPNRTIATGANTTFTIRTNTDVNNVWVRDADGREFNATRTSDTANARNWTVTFSPLRSGTVAVYANATRTTDGAARRTETLTIGHTNASVLTANVQWQTGNNLVITATTNNAAQTVWAVLPGGNRVQLNQITPAAATGNRTWSTTADSTTTSNIPHGSVITIGASGIFSNTVQNMQPDDTRNAVWGAATTGQGIITSVAHWSAADNVRARGQVVEFRVRTIGAIDEIRLTGAHGTLLSASHTTIGNEREWRVSVWITNTAPQNQFISFNARAYIGNTFVATEPLPATFISP